MAHAADQYPMVERPIRVAGVMAISKHQDADGSVLSMLETAADDWSNEAITPGSVC